MLFQALWLSIVPFQHLPYVPTLASLLSVCLELAVLRLQSLSPHSPRSISLSLRCLKSSFLVISLLQDSFWIVSRVILQTLGPFLPPSNPCLYSHDDIVLWNGSLFCHICPWEVAKGSFSEHWPFYLVLTLLLGEMLVVARNGPHGGKLRLWGEGW